jgi:hypothetical protein
VSFNKTPLLVASVFVGKQVGKPVVDDGFGKFDELIFDS